MTPADSQSDKWYDNQPVIEAIVSYFGSLEEVHNVEWIYQGYSAMVQYLIRVWTTDGEVIRMGIEFPDDDELVDGFDESFPPQMTIDA